MIDFENDFKYYLFNQKRKEGDGMLTTERHQLILNLLKEKQSIKIQELVELTAASESTIRRDLTELEELQKLERVFGGASRIAPNMPEPSLSDKAAKNLKKNNWSRAMRHPLLKQATRCSWTQARRRRK